MSETDAAVLATVRNRVGHLVVSGQSGCDAASQQLQAQLQAWETNSHVLAVMLRLKPGESSPTGKRDDAGPMPDIRRYSKPVLVLLDGALTSRSVPLWHQATLRALTEASSLEMSRGSALDAAGAELPPARLPASLARYLTIIQQPLSPADALYAGLADYCLPNEMVAEFDRCLDGMSWNTHPREALRTLLATVATRKMPGSELKALRLAIDEHFAFDSVAAVRASLEREMRQAYQDWADETLALLDSRCRGPVVGIPA